jgi:hypothetical protein
MKDMPQSSNKPDTKTSSIDSVQLLQQIMLGQEAKNPDLAAKQGRLLEILKANSSNQMPSV